MLPTNLDELLGCFFQGEFSALGTIAQKHNRELFRIIDSEWKRYLGDPIISSVFDRDDIRQVLFLNLLHHWQRGRYHLPDNSLAYVRCLLRHTLIDVWRDWAGSTPQTRLKSRSRSIHLDALPDIGPLPDEIVAEREERQYIFRMLNPTDEELWRLFTQGNPPHEIAKQSRRSASTIRAQIRRMIVRIRNGIPTAWRKPHDRVKRFRRPLKLVELRQPFRFRKSRNDSTRSRFRERILAILRKSKKRSSLSYRPFTEPSKFRS